MTWDQQTFDLIYFAGMLLLCGGAALSTYFIVRPGGPGRPAWNRYLSSIDVWLNLLASQSSPIEVVGYQILCAATLVAAKYVFGMDYLVYLIPFIVPITYVGMRIAHEKRCIAIGLQLDGWLLMLANMLKATGNVGNAIESSSHLVNNPLKPEVELIVKQFEVGMTIDESLANMYKRVPSIGLRTVVTSLRVGRRLGGDLPSLLAENAAALRESERIEGYIRSQVSQGKAQMIVLALAPLALIYMFIGVNADFFDPLLNHVLGPYIIIGCVVLWVAALIIGFKIMNVDA